MVYELCSIKQKHSVSSGVSLSVRVNAVGKESDSHMNCIVFYNKYFVDKDYKMLQHLLEFASKSVITKCGKLIAKRIGLLQNRSLLQNAAVRNGVKQLYFNSHMKKKPEFVIMN